MSERGVFAIDRGVWEHDFLADDQPFSRREAWFWLVSEAAWKPHRRRITGKVIELCRGQYVGSLRFIASKWRWSEPRVRRFLGGLISEGMIDAKTDAGVTVITICNYDKYQRVSLPSDATPKIDVDAGATQERRKVEDKEYKEDISCPVGKPTRTKASYSDEFERFWQAYPRTPTMSKSEAWKAWQKIPPDDRASAVQAIEPYKLHLRSKPNLETVHACRFLSQRRFEGFGDAAPAKVFDIRSHLV